MRRHRYTCRVRFSDVDVYGHVNNVKYFEYYQEARLAFMAEIAGVEGTEAPDLSRVVRRVDVDYRRPILFREEPYLVETWVSRVGTSSFTLESEIRDGEEVLSRATAVIVTFDATTQRARPLTGLEREQLAAVAEA
jgi:acyl-CoA thioester hydrolase